MTAHAIWSRTPHRPVLVAALLPIMALGLVATSPPADAAVDNPPVARVKAVVPNAANPLVVRASARASSDTDATPIARYAFTFGDGTGAVTVNAPTSTARHTYAAGGTYTISVVVTDTAGLTGTASTSITVASSQTTDNPPVARLKASVPSASAPLTARADASASSDADSTPIAGYAFTFGDGSPAVTVTAPTTTADHTYAAEGTYTVSVTVADTAGNTGTASTTVTVGQAPPPPPPDSIAVYAGYYDDHHPGDPQPKPDPWKGSSGVVFVGKPDNKSGGWDTSTVRVDNLSGETLSGVVVKVDIGSHRFALWGTQSIPAGGTLVVAQTAYANFDGSDLNPAGCYGCNSKLCQTSVSSTVPVVHVTVDGKTYDFADTGQVLNTHGVDSAGCPATGQRNDESIGWRLLN